MELCDLIGSTQKSAAFKGLYHRLIGPTLLEKMALPTPTPAELQQLVNAARNAGKTLKGAPKALKAAPQARKALKAAPVAAYTHAPTSAEQIAAMLGQRGAPAAASAASHAPTSPSTIQAMLGNVGAKPPVAPPPSVAPIPAPAAAPAPRPAAPATAPAPAKPSGSGINTALLALLGAGGYTAGQAGLEGLKEQYGAEEIGRQQAAIQEMLAQQAVEARRTRSYEDTLRKAYGNW